MEALFDDWYARLRPSMGAALAAWCGDAGIAAEALDEAFVRAVERWDRVSTMESPAGWVWRTATNEARRRARRSAIERRLLRRHLCDGLTEGRDQATELDLRAALLELTERQRTAVVLHHIVDLPIVDVAAALGVATGTVSATLHQARARLAARLGTPGQSDAANAATPVNDVDGALP